MAVVQYAESVGGRIASEWAQATRKSMDLLHSLLNERQRKAWTRWGHFWIGTERGQFRIGGQDTRYRPATKPDREFRLCIVLEGPYASWQPPADQWSTILLQIVHDPSLVVRTGVFLGVRSTGNGPLLAHLRQALDGVAGPHRSGALLDLGTMLLLRGDPHGAEAALRESIVITQPNWNGSFRLVNLAAKYLVGDKELFGLDIGDSRDADLSEETWGLVVGGVKTALGQ